MNRLEEAYQNLQKSSDNLMRHAKISVHWYNALKYGLLAGILSVIVYFIYNKKTNPEVSIFKTPIFWLIVFTMMVLVVVSYRCFGKTEVYKKRNEESLKKIATVIVEDYLPSSLVKVPVWNEDSYEVNSQYLTLLEMKYGEIDRSFFDSDLANGGDEMYFDIYLLDIATIEGLKERLKGERFQEIIGEKIAEKLALNYLDLLIILDEEAGIENKIVYYFDA